MSDGRSEGTLNKGEVAPGGVPTGAVAPAAAILDGNTDGRNLVLLVGCPRSGTTWLQRLLAEHPLVSTGQESHVFKYLVPMLRRWRGDLARAGERPSGLACFLDEEEFERILRDFTKTLLQPLVGTLRPGELFVEKTPSHARILPEIREILPRVRVVHMVRDPRDVVASLLAASQSWGRGWAPSTTRGAARKWLSYQRDAERAKALFPPEQLLEVTYEGFERDTVGELARVLSFLDLPVDAGQLAEAVENNRGGGGTAIPLAGEVVRRGGSRVVEEPEGFIRRARSGGWRSDLGPLQKLTVWRLLRREMARKGYPWALPY